MERPVYYIKGVVRDGAEATQDFVGPLDLILHLLQKNRIAVRDIPLAGILAQFLTWMSSRRALDLEVAGEFISMASHLMLIKTKMLLSAAEREEAENEMDLLRQSLLERQRKEAMEQIRIAITALEPRNDIGRCVFTKQPEPLRRDKTYRYVHEPSDLLRALDDIAARNARRLPPPTVNFKGIVGKEPYPVTKKATELMRSLILRGVERLKNLFRGSKSRSEIVATFLAILEMCKTNAVTLEDDVSGENPNVRLLEVKGREEV